MELAEYRRMAEVEDTHWWYRSTRALLQAAARRPAAAGRSIPRSRCGDGGHRGVARRPRTSSSPPTSSRWPSRCTASCTPTSEVVACDATSLPFADDSFDAVLCVTVLCHRSIESPAAAVAEMARVVRPGGLVCLWEPGVRRLRRAHDRVTHTGRRFSRRDLAGPAHRQRPAGRAGDRRLLVPRPAGRGQDAARARRDVERPRPQRERAGRRAAGDRRSRASAPQARRPAGRALGGRHRPAAVDLIKFKARLSNARGGRIAHCKLRIASIAPDELHVS